MTPTPRRRLLPRRAPLRALAMAALLASVAACQASRTTTTAAPREAPQPQVAVQAGPGGLVDWAAPLVVTVTDGTLSAVTVTDPQGYDVPGHLGRTRWQSRGTLVPSSGYHVTARVEDGNGTSRRVDLTAATSPATKVLTAELSPSSYRVVGIGLPAIVLLNRPVTSPQDRAAVVSRLSVETTPPVAGAWRWMSPTELHYRGPRYWAKGTVVQVQSDLQGLRLSQGVWGSGSAQTSFGIGSAVIATVDVAKKSMAVTVDGTLVRTVKVSTGRDKYPTKGGVHLVLEKIKVEVMDSATVGIPRNSPDGYYEKVPNSVRISYGGAFVHSASWSVRDQGVRDVSHGCVNISPADAEWFFGLVKRGDVVDIVNAKAPPLLSDPGMSDWNVPFTEWANS